MSLFNLLEAFSCPAIVTDDRFIIIYFNKAATLNEAYGGLLRPNAKLIPDIFADKPDLSSIETNSCQFLTGPNNGHETHFSISSINLNEGVFYLFVNELSDQLTSIESISDNSGQPDRQTNDNYKDQLDALLKNLPGVVFISSFTEDRNLIKVSPGSKRLFGFAPHELVGNKQASLSQVIHEEDRNSVWKSIQENLKHHLYYRIQYRIVAKNGKTKWVEEQTRAILNAQNEIDYLEGIITDINQIKLSENALRFEVNLNQAFASISIDLLKGFVNIDQIADSVVQYSMNFTDSSAALLLLPIGEGNRYQVFVSGQKNSIQTQSFFEIDAETLESGFLKKYLRLTAPVIDNSLKFRGEIAGIPDKQFELKRMMAIPAIFENQMASILILANANTDYSHTELAIGQRFLNVFTLAMFKLKAEEGLRFDKEKAENSDKMKSLFLSNMSHDLRTPMNAIVGFADMLRETNLNIEEKDKFLEAIIRSGDNLLRLVNDIIDISKIEAGELRLIMSECNLNQLIDDIELSTIQALGRHHKQRVKFYSQKGVPGDTFMILTDVTRLQQILTNLTGNAVKFTDEGFIEVGYRIESSKLLFFVRDSGLGIPAEDQKLIFQRFGQASQFGDRNKSGTGLGLTISKNLVELMGGSIWLDSWPGEGTTFWFILPLLKAQKHEARNILEPNLKQSIVLTGKTILVVEDVDTNYFYLSSLLNKLNCTVLRAANGQSAVDMGISDASIDMILMDIELPLKNGYEATREIKAVRPDLPIVAQTAFAMMGERERSEEAGCDDYMAKPIRKDQLINMVLKYIG